jgi:hypothetical protein
MNRDYFDKEIGRLATGHGASVSKERIEATWRVYGHVRNEVFRRAIDRCLIGQRYPTVRELDDAIEVAQNQRAGLGPAILKCECGSPLELPPERPSILFPKQPGLNRGTDHDPSLWTMLMARRCSDEECRRRYWLPTENTHIIHRSGRRIRLQRGLLLPAGDLADPVTKEEVIATLSAPAGARVPPAAPGGTRNPEAGAKAPQGRPQ